MDRAKLTYMLTLAAGAGTALTFVWWWLRSKEKKKSKPPSKWHQVGEISDLFVFPVKSLGYIRQTSVECTTLGCKSGWLRDRNLMVVDLNGKFITARKIPRMVKVQPSVTGSILTLSAPEMPSINIDLARINKKSFMTAVWDQPVSARDCGKDVAQWLSRFLLQEDTGLRLVYYPLDVPTRDVRLSNKGFPLMESSDVGAFPDTTSYNLMNEASITDLNTRLEEQVTPVQFRPNFVVKGAKPLEEDNWDWIKIGSVIFRNIRPCTRCIFTTINPETGEKNSKTEPLKTLREYRQIDDPIVRPFVGSSPVMGIHLGLKGPNGVVRMGDPVYIGVSDDDDISVSSTP